MNTDERKGNILIVDDNLDNLGLLSTLLSDRGYQVRKAINGKIALMGVRAETPDLILLDILMPDMDGYEVCRQLKKHPDTASIPVIFLSALDEAIDKVKGFKVGGADYIAKPFQAEEVLARVEHQLQIQHLQQQLRQQNAHLQEREHRLSTILATMSDGLIVLNRERKVCFANPAAPLLLDTTVEQLLDHYFAWEIAIEETREVEVFLASGAIRVLAIGAEKTMWDENPAILLSLKDITERKQAETALKQAKIDAETASQAKSTFLSSVSHELRTPLHAILGFSGILAEENLGDRQQENLKIIRRSGEHLLELIEDILFVSKIEAGLVTLHVTAFDLCQLLDFIRNVFQQKAQTKGLQLIWEYDANLPEYMTGDRSKLRQVLLNLVGNAIAFTEKGSVTLRVQPLRAVKGNRNISFEIEDTGVGIAQEEIETLFDPLMQTKRNEEFHQGTGLGLAISQKFVDLMGGEIKVKSTVGKGSLFSFMIPDVSQSSFVKKDSNFRDRMDSKDSIGLASGQTQYRDRDENEPKSVASTLKKQDLQMMSSEWMQELHQASIKLDIKKMLELVEEIPQSEIDLIDTLKYLVNDFRIDIIQELTIV